MATSRYIKPLDEAELFSWGATAFRVDVGTWGAIQAALGEVVWERSTWGPVEGAGHVPERPIGRLAAPARTRLAQALSIMVNDPVLVPGIAQMGVLQVGGVEIQNGALDDGWHHDGLAGKRHGHAGDFFLLCYAGAAVWEEDWGGHFEYAQRDLGPNWPAQGFVPRGPVRRVAPAARTAVLGWNQNPCLIHRAPLLQAPQDRPTIIASLDLIPR